MLPVVQELLAELLEAQKKAQENRNYKEVRDMFLIYHAHDTEQTFQVMSTSHDRNCKNPFEPNPLQMKFCSCQWSCIKSETNSSVFRGTLKSTHWHKPLGKKILMLSFSTLLCMTCHSKYLFMNSIASKILLKWHCFVPNNPKLPETNRKFLSISKYLQNSNNKPLQVKDICCHRLRGLTPRYYSYRNCMYLGGESIGENFH